MNENPDIIENTLRNRPELLPILLVDRTRQKRENELAKKRKNKTPRTCNILWATESYAGHRPTDEILAPEITGRNTYVIQPRIAKSKEEQKRRVKAKAEVFTPREIVEEMNKQIDWATEHWPVTAENWQDYVQELKLEITCGEAPFIVGRYNAATGKKVLKLSDRVGFLDRKMQAVSKFCEGADLPLGGYDLRNSQSSHDSHCSSLGNLEDLGDFTLAQKKFIYWSKVAFESSYGYEWQGDNLLLARENLLYTFIDYWNEKFPEDRINLDDGLPADAITAADKATRGIKGKTSSSLAPDKSALLQKFAKIISWNIFQMDGLKGVIPMSCKYEVVQDEVPPIFALLGEKPKTRKVGCEGCRTNNIRKHNGIYARVMDWGKGQTVRFVDLMR